MTIEISEDEAEGLAQLAAEELRTPKAQVQWLVRQALKVNVEMRAMRELEGRHARMRAALLEESAPTPAVLSSVPEKLATE